MINIIQEVFKDKIVIKVSPPAYNLLMNPEAIPYICAIKNGIGQIIGYADSRPAHIPLFIREVKK